MKAEKIFSIVLILVGFIGLYFLKDAAPIVRLFAASIAMIWIIKIGGILWQKADGATFQSPLGFFLFFFAWPGISVTGFTKRERIPESTGLRFLESWIAFLVGIGILIVVSLWGRGESTLLNYVALLSILLIIHLGLLEAIADGIRLCGFSPMSLFNRPYLATSLRDFWSVRWNRAFVDMSKIFIMKPLKNKISSATLTFSIFVISGILHELAISYADGVSWGKPFLYFVVQGVGMEIEKKIKFPKFFQWCWILIPAPLLFSPAFTNLFLGGFARLISDFIFSVKVEDIFHYGLILGGFFHLLVLCASIQVPGKLDWKNEFQKLNSLNRKAFWTYGGYIFSIIVFMSMVSFLLAHQDFHMSTLPTFMWVFFIAFFWWARVLIDLFYMNHEDWPQGPLFTIGHICLTTLFISVSVLYTLLAFLVFKEMK
jgi:hypothetical protein